MDTSTDLVARIDALGGIAGDMFAGACADAWPQYCDSVLEDIRSVGFPNNFTCGFHWVTVNHFAVRHFKVDPAAGQQKLNAGYMQIIDQLESSGLCDDVKHHARGIFEILGRAEATVHNQTLENVHFHELANWDSVADIVAAASFIARVDVERWFCGSLPMGGGRVSTAHGKISVPAPAVLEILKDFHWIDDGVSGERVTPTGAAILRYLVCTGDEMRSLPGGRLTAVGSGAGSQSFDQLANITRIVAFRSKEAALNENVVELAFEIDDMTPEELSVGLEHIRLAPGVFDAGYGIRYGKKGRIQFSVHVLAANALIDEVVCACFNETTTLGVRKKHVSRAVLQRASTECSHDDKTIIVKSALRPEGVSTHKAENDHVAKIPTLSARRAFRIEVERYAATALETTHRTK